MDKLKEKVRALLYHGYDAAISDANKICDYLTEAYELGFNDGLNRVIEEMKAVR